MAKPKGTEYRVGLLVAVGLFIFMVAVLFLGSHEALLKRRYELRAAFADIGGLTTGAPVRLQGVDVGRVTEIYFTPAAFGEKPIQIAFEVNHSVKKWLKEDSVASIETMGLLGDKYIALTQGSRGARELETGEYVRALEPPDLYQALRKGGEILDDLTEIAESARSFIAYLDREAQAGELVDHLSSSSRSLDSILRKIDQGEGTLGALVNDPTAYEDLLVVLGGAKRSGLVKRAIRYTIGKYREEEEEE